MIGNKKKHIVYYDIVVLLICIIVLFTFKFNTTKSYNIKVGVHIKNSKQQHLHAMLIEVRSIYLKIGVNLNFIIKQNDRYTNNGLDIWLVERIGDDNCDGLDYLNGCYKGPHDIVVIDNSVLDYSPNSVEYNTSRAIAHEIGHAFGLDHPISQNLKIIRII